MITNLDLVAGRAGKAGGDQRRAVRLSLYAAAFDAELLIQRAMVKSYRTR
jgi:hypothetical protein